MRKKMKVNFLAVSRKDGKILKDSTVYVYANSKEEAENNAYKLIKNPNQNFAYKDEIILVYCK